MPLPQYIREDGIGDPQIPPPYFFKDVKIRSFRLLADRRNLKKLCARFLNIGDFSKRGFTYCPILPFVDLEVLYYWKMNSEHPDFANRGCDYQNECVFRVFVGKYDKESPGPGDLPTEVAVFVPFIIVDSSLSVISGREVMGYPKVWGRFELPQRGQDYPLNILANVFRRHHPDEDPALAPVVTIENLAPPLGTPLSAILTTAFTGLGDALDDFSGTYTAAIDTIAGTYVEFFSHAEDEYWTAVKWPWTFIDVDPLLNPFADIIRDAGLDSFLSIQLKQFLDAQQTDRACYQGLVSGRFVVSPDSIRNLKPLPPAKITIPDYPSLTIVSHLGLGAGAIPSIGQYELTCDMRLADVRNVFVLP